MLVGRRQPWWAWWGTFADSVLCSAHGGCGDCRETGEDDEDPYRQDHAPQRRWHRRLCGRANRPRPSPSRLPRLRTQDADHRLDDIPRGSVPVLRAVCNSRRPRMGDHHPIARPTRSDYLHRPLVRQSTLQSPGGASRHHPACRRGAWRALASAGALLVLPGAWFRKADGAATMVQCGTSLGASPSTHAAGGPSLWRILARPDRRGTVSARKHWAVSTRVENERVRAGSPIDRHERTPCWLRF